MKTWLDELKTGDRVVCHFPEEDLIQIRYVYWSGADIQLTKGTMIFNKRNGYSQDRKVFLSPYFSQLDGILPEWGSPPRVTEIGE